MDIFVEFKGVLNIYLRVRTHTLMQYSDRTKNIHEKFLIKIQDQNRIHTSNQIIN